MLLMRLSTRLAPDLMDEFLGSAVGVVVLFAVVVMVVSGFLWIRKITTIDV